MLHVTCVGVGVGVGKFVYTCSFKEYSVYDSMYSK